MESYDERRRREEERRGRQEDSGPHRDTWWHRGEERSRQAETGWLDYDRDYGRSDERQGRRDEGRDQGGREERTRFSPDWSRESAEPRYSDHPYYSRNREQDSGDYSRGERSGGWQSDDRRQWEQRARASVPRSQRELAERGEPGDYYDPDWPYDRGRQRDLERSRGRQQTLGRQQTRGREEEGSHYRGYYSQSGGPFSYPGGQGYVFSESLTLHGPYTGRGPKGYKRSDEKIMEEACQRLERDGEIDASNIEVSADDGVIRLRGTVEDRQTKRRAEECVESIYGVRDVMNELRVTPQSGQQWQGEGTQASQSGRSMQTSQTGQATQASQGMQTPGMPEGEQPDEDRPVQRH